MGGYNTKKPSPCVCTDVGSHKIKIRLFAPVFLCLVIAINSYADTGSVVFGSWEVLANAENGLRKVHDTLGLKDLRLVRSVVNGKSYHRLVSDALPEAEARALIAKATTHGYQAWYLQNAAQPRSGTPSESAGTQSVRCKNGQPHRLTLRHPLSPALTIHRRCPGKHSRRMIALFADKLIISTENNSLACRCQPGPQPNGYPRAIQTSETTPCVFLRSDGKARYASYPLKSL